MISAFEPADVIPWITVVFGLIGGWLYYRAADKQKSLEVSTQTVGDLAASNTELRAQVVELRAKVMAQEERIRFLQSMAMTPEALQTALTSMVREVTSSLMQVVTQAAGTATRDGVQTVMDELQRQERTYLIPLATGAARKAWES